MARNLIFSEATFAKVNKENTDILNDYVLEMKSNGKSTGTITQYTADIKMFYCWVYENLQNKSILELKKRDFRRFFLGLQDGSASPARINRVQCSLRNMLEFCSQDEDEYDYAVNVMSSIKGLQKEEVREIIFLENSDIEAMLDLLCEQKKYQLALYLALSYESASRRNEVFQVKKDKFLDENRTNEVVGKRKKKFKLLYFNRAREIAALYFEQRGEDTIESMWTTGKGDNKQPAKYETLYNWTLSLRNTLKEATGKELKFNPHSFRHSSLEAYENGTHYVLKELGKDKLDIKILKVLANHSDISTTMSYLKNKDEELLNDSFGI